jgi:hypothetical protein
MLLAGLPKLPQLRSWAGCCATLAGVSASSDRALLSSVTTQVDELAHRVTELADQYGTTPDSAIAAELYTVERSLNAAIRSLDRATRLLNDIA